LKLRAGLVRCGACKQIFNGIENLLPAEDAEQKPEAPATPQPAPAEPAPPSSSSSAVPAETSEEPSVPAATASAETPSRQDAAVPADPGAPIDDPLLRMTLMDFSYSERRPETPVAAEEMPDPLDHAIEDLQQRPWRSAENESADEESDELDRVEEREYEEPDFVRQGRRRQRLGRIFRLTMAIGLPLLALLLAAQFIYTFRDRIAARYPQAKPLLVQACRPLGCSIGLPAQIDYVSLESSELQTLSADNHTFVLALLLLNRNETVEAWPSIELTLNDANDKPMARRVFAPADYLGSAGEAGKGFAPRSEQAVKLYFSMDGAQASGYRAYLFYP
jgi:hypothetical protein